MEDCHRQKNGNSSCNDNQRKSSSDDLSKDTGQSRCEQKQKPKYDAHKKGGNNNDRSLTITRTSYKTVNNIKP